MSLPVKSFFCTACDFRCGAIKFWGPKEYVLNTGVRIPLDWQLGWCRECNDLEAIEFLSYEKCADNLRRAELALVAHASTKMRIWKAVLDPFRWREKQRDWKEQYFFQLSSRDDASDSLSLSESQRQRGPKCLSCGARCTADALIDESRWAYQSTPHSLNFKHPGCDGEIWREDTGMRIAMSPPVRRYTPECDFIGDEPVAGYSGPDHDFFQKREVENAIIRGRAIPKDFL